LATRPYRNERAQHLARILLALAWDEVGCDPGRPPAIAMREKQRGVRRATV
jgi:hypothetical protein